MEMDYWGIYNKEEEEISLVEKRAWLGEMIRQLQNK